MHAGHRPRRALARGDRPRVGAHRTASASAARPRTSRCYASSACRSAGGSTSTRVRARDRGDEPAARPGVDAARDLLRLAAARHARARSSAGLASSCPGLIAIIALSAAVPVGLASRGWLRGAGAGRRRRRGRGRGRAPGSAIAAPMWRADAASRRGRASLAYGLAGALAAARSRARGWCSCCSRAGPSSSQCASAPDRGARRAPGLRRGCSPSPAGCRALRDRGSLALPLLGADAGAQSGGAAALAWTAFKVGALAFGGGFVIVPLMQADAVGAYHWMSHTQFLNAVALGQVTPGPGHADDRRRRLLPPAECPVRCSPPPSPSRRRSRSSSSARALRAAARERARAGLSRRRGPRRRRRDHRRGRAARGCSSSRAGSSSCLGPPRSHCSLCDGESSSRCCSPAAPACSWACSAARCRGDAGARPFVLPRPPARSPPSRAAPSRRFTGRSHDCLRLVTKTRILQGILLMDEQRENATERRRDDAGGHALPLRRLRSARDSASSAPSGCRSAPPRPRRSTTSPSGGAWTS